MSPHQSENQEASGLGIVMLFFMPVAITLLIGAIGYLGATLAHI